MPSLPALPSTPLHPPSALEDALACVERQMDALSAHLLAGDAPALEHSSAALRQALAVLAPHRRKAQDLEGVAAG